MTYSNIDVERIAKTSENVTEIVVPEGVTEIGVSAFRDVKETIEKVVLPQSLEKIAEDAFYNCKKLTIVNLPDNLTEIGKNAFSSCESLSNVTFPKSLKKIGNNAFYKTNLQKIELSEGIEEIGFGAFSYTKIEELIFPESVTNKDSNYSLSCANYCENLKKVHIPSSIKTFSFMECTNLEEFNLPEGIEEIASFALENTAIKELKLPSTVKIIQNSAFASCKKLSKVELNDGLETIERNAFYNCINITNIKFPDSLKKIDGFNGTSLKEVVFPKNVEEIRDFSDCLFEKVEIPEGVSTIGNFKNCKNLKEIKLPKKLVYKTVKGRYSDIRIGEVRSFEGCENLENIELPENLENISSNLFKDCKKLKEIKIPSTAKYVGGCTFENCESLTELEIPNSAKAVINGCKNLSKLVFKGSVIEENTLFGADNLEELICDGALSKIEKFAFYSTYFDNTEKKYKPSFTSNIKKIVLPATIEKIEDEAFYSFDKLSEIVIPSDCKKYEVKSGCLYAKSTKRLVRAYPIEIVDGKEKYVIPKGIKAIAPSAFPNSAKDAIIEIEAKIEKISDEAIDRFKKSSLNESTIGANVIFNAMNLASAKAEKIGAIKKAGTEGIIESAFEGWEYGFSKTSGSSPTRTVYIVNLPFGAKFNFNVSPKVTQKEAQMILTTMTELKQFVGDALALFKKVRELHESCTDTIKSTYRTLGKIFFSEGTYGDRTTSVGELSVDFVKKDIADIFKGSKLKYSTEIIEQEKDKDGKQRPPLVKVFIKKENIIVIYNMNEWSLFGRSRMGGSEDFEDTTRRMSLENLIKFIQNTNADEIKDKVYEETRLYGLTTVDLSKLI